MEIKGFVPTSLVDWDGKISSVIFLPLCNFRCPWCYARDLVLEPERLQTVPFKKVADTLSCRKNWVDGLVITGGEPTLHSGLLEFCAKIKNLGFPVKLDTNGTNPAMVKKLVENNLVSYIAMDVKAPLTDGEYNKVNGAKNLVKNVRESIALIMGSGVGYEFRTTLVPGLHTLEDVGKIASSIKGARKYALQNFRVPYERGKLIDEKFYLTKPFAKGEMEAFQSIARKFVENVVIRS